MIADRVLILHAGMIIRDGDPFMDVWGTARVCDCCRVSVRKFTGWGSGIAQNEFQTKCGVSP